MLKLLVIGICTLEVNCTQERQQPKCVEEKFVTTHQGSPPKMHQDLRMSSGMDPFDGLERDSFDAFSGWRCYSTEVFPWNQEEKNRIVKFSVSSHNLSDQLLFNITYSSSWTRLYCPQQSQIHFMLHQLIRFKSILVRIVVETKHTFRLER